ncbi:hypothetical protein TIFTF001_014983 [Ficus carica]|uniref:Uncharacterized protein n=1 Tax=Ficus carica TaxID=3494 RepID=A0AA87ZXV8_FICCA|nr:hypothetical protein TIFTF001_014983 [Ficus carica]
MRGRQAAYIVGWLFVFPILSATAGSSLSGSSPSTGTPAGEKDGTTEAAPSASGTGANWLLGRAAALGTEGKGPYPFNLKGANGALESTSLIFPVPGYNHSEVNKKYSYADLYAVNIWATVENPENSGNFSGSLIPFSCAADSPTDCGDCPGSTLPNLGYVYSFEEDNKKDVFILASNGVCRVVLRVGVTTLARR